jgi:probable O-glycosylation ligase (exosortase A-associated)
VRTPLAALIYLACVAIPFLYPWDGVGLYMLIAAVRPQNITWGLELAGGRYSIVCMGAIMVGWGLRVLGLGGGRGSFFPRWGPFHLLLILFTAQCLVSRFFAVDPVAAHIQFMMILIPIVMSLVTVQVLRTEEQLYRASWFLTIGLGFLGWWSFYLAHFTSAYEERSDGEITGPGGMLVDRNDFSMGLNMALPLLFFMGISAKRRWVRVLSIVSMGPATAIVIESGSRGAFLGLAAVGSYILYKMHHKRWVLGLAFVGLIGALSVVPPEYYERVTGIASAASTDSSAQGRLNSWGAAIEMARDKPLTGVGLGCFTVDYFRYAPDATFAVVAHNSFFQMLGTAGIPGAVLWLWIVARMWFLLGRLERRLRAVRLSWSRLHYMVLALRTSHVGYVVCGTFLSMEDLEFFYYEIGLTAALALIVGERVTAVEKELKAAQPQRS